MPIVKQLKVHLDERGYLYEMLRNDDPFFTQFGQAYLSVTNPGVIKGFHRHQKQTDHIVCISGQIKLVLINLNNVLMEYHLAPIDPKIVIVEPNIWHGWMCIGNEPACIINFSTHLHDPLHPDEERMDPINNSFGYSWSVKNK